MLHATRLLLVLLLTFPAANALALGTEGRTYDYYLTGSPADATAATEPGLLLVGGGSDVDPAFVWFLERTGGGDVVVIRASGSDGYNPYLYRLGDLDSVETIVFKRRRASYDPDLIARLERAEGVFLAGGDQADYLRLWRDTPVMETLQGLAERGVPLGGTSAGLAVLGELFFSARFGSVTSSEALADPYHWRVQLGDGFLQLAHLEYLITDSHFAERDRMGRLIAFLARLRQDGLAPAEARAIAVDEATAVAVDGDGEARVMGEGAAYFLRTAALPEVCEPRTPLTFRGIPVYRLDAGGIGFSLPAWEGQGGVAYEISAEAGVLGSTQAGGEIY